MLLPGNSEASGKKGNIRAVGPKSRTRKAFPGTLLFSSYTAAVFRTRICAVVFLLSIPLKAADHPSLGTLRWAEGAPNCTLRDSDDGHVYYGLSYTNFTVTMGIDRQELAKIPHRAIPIIAVFVSIQYTGSDNLEIAQDRFALEFVKHRHVVQPALDPGNLMNAVQNIMNDVSDEIERHQIRKHPAQREAKEKELQTWLKDYTEMMDFISTRAFRSTTLDTTYPEISGWLFFSTKNRWIGSWRPPERLTLRFPVENLVVELPFQLPPKAGKPELRTRPKD